MGEISSNTQSISFYKLIAKAEKGDLKTGNVIAKVEKQGDQYAVTKFLKGISGFLTKAEVREFEYEGKKQKKLILQLTDSSGICQLEFTPTNAAAGVINCLLGADLTKEISIEAWTTKPNDKGMQFVNACAKYVGSQDSIAWAIELKDIPRPVEYKTPSGETATDSANVKNFWIEKFQLAIMPRAVAGNFTGTINPQPTEQQVSVEAQAPLRSSPEPLASSPFVNESDLPF